MLFSEVLPQHSQQRQKEPRSTEKHVQCLDAAKIFKILSYLQFNGRQMKTLIVPAASREMKNSADSGSAPLLGTEELAGHSNPTHSPPSSTTKWYAFPDHISLIRMHSEDSHTHPVCSELPICTLPNHTACIMP